MTLTAANFAKPHPGVATIRRRDMNVRVANSGKVGTATPAGIAEAKRRFAICQTCENSRDKAFACVLYEGCCFGRYRASPDSHCPQLKW